MKPSRKIFTRDTPTHLRTSFGITDSWISCGVALRMQRWFCTRRKSTTCRGFNSRGSGRALNQGLDSRLTSLHERICGETAAPFRKKIRKQNQKAEIGDRRELGEGVKLFSASRCDGDRHDRHQRDSGSSSEKTGPEQRAATHLDGGNKRNHRFGRWNSKALEVIRVPCGMSQLPAPAHEECGGEGESGEEGRERLKISRLHSLYRLQRTFPLQRTTESPGSQESLT